MSTRKGGEPGEEELTQARPRRGTETTAETGGTTKTAGGDTGWTGKPMDWETSKSDEDQTSSCVKGRSGKVEAPNKDATNEGAWGYPPRLWRPGTAALPKT